MNLVRLKAARERKQLSQAALARQLGVTQTLPGQWERGEKVPSADKLQRLAELLGVTASWLLGEKVVDVGNIYTPHPTGPQGILTDSDSPPGLRELASRSDLVAALDIAPAEWTALRSLIPTNLLSIDGYVGVLLIMRGSAKTTDAPLDAS